MTDDDLITLMRESFTDLHTTTPVEQILRRGHAVRARRRIPVLTAGLAFAAGAALAVTTLLPGHQAGPHPGPRPTAELAAWTVVKQADGAIQVTIRELRDPAGLQRQLRADGVPASITLIGQENPSCRPYPPDPALQRKIVTPAMEPASPQSGTSGPGGPGPDPGLVVVLLIHPSALPSGVGIQFATSFTQVSPTQAHGTARLDLVYASPQCTGS